MIEKNMRPQFHEDQKPTNQKTNIEMNEKPGDSTSSNPDRENERNDENHEQDADGAPAGTGVRQALRKFGLFAHASYLRSPFLRKLETLFIHNQKNFYFYGCKNEIAKAWLKEETILFHRNCGCPQPTRR